MNIPFRPLVAALSLGLASGAFAQHAHEHGVADLRVAVEGSTLLVEFESPLANLVGFEHEARTDAERKAMADLEKRLRAGTGLVSLPASAGCSLKDVELEMPGVDEHAHHDHKHDDHKHDKHTHSHGDKKAHDHGHKHDDHKHAHDDHDHDHEHSDAYVAWEFECKKADALDAIQVDVIEAYPAIRVLRAETASPRGQQAVRIEAPKARLPL